MVLWGFCLGELFCGWVWVEKRRGDGSGKGGGGR